MAFYYNSPNQQFALHKLRERLNGITPGWEVPHFRKDEVFYKNINVDYSLTVLVWTDEVSAKYDDGRYVREVREYRAAIQAKTWDKFNVKHQYHKLVKGTLDEMLDDISDTVKRTLARCKLMPPEKAFEQTLEAYEDGK